MSKKKNAAIYAAILLGLLVWNFNSFLSQAITDGLGGIATATGWEWLNNFYVQSAVTMGTIALILLVLLKVSWKTIERAFL